MCKVCCSILALPLSLPALSRLLLPPGLGRGQTPQFSCPLALLSPCPFPVPCRSLTGSTGARGTAGSQGGGKWPSPGIWLGFILMGRS